MVLRQGKPKRTDLFHRISVLEYDKVVEFDGGNLNTTTKKGKIYGDEVFAVYVVALMVAVFFMVVSNIIVWKTKRLNGWGIAAVTATATVVTAATVAAVAEEHIVTYKIFSVIFYIFAILAMLL